MRQLSSEELENTDFPAVRRVMGEEKAYLSDHDIEQYLIEAFPDSYPDDVENFMRSLQSFARRAAPVAQRALGGAVQGAAAGSVAGPYGMLAGALIGGTASALTTPSNIPTRPAAPTQTPQPAPQLTPTTTGVPQASQQQRVSPTIPTTSTPITQANAGSSVLVQQLLALLARPETQQALLGLLMNNRAVSVNRTQIPAQTFVNAIAELSTAISEEIRSEFDDSWYYDDHGCPKCDLGMPLAKSNSLIRDLHRL